MVRLSRGAKSALRSLAASSTYGFWSRLPLGRGMVKILTYHRVLPERPPAGEFVQPGMYVTEAAFERQLGYLRRAFTVLSVKEMLQLWDEGLWSDRERYAVITFDDGWVDTFRHAFPILRSHGVPATVFLPTERIGTNHWFWPDRLGHLLTRHGLGSREARLQIMTSLPGYQVGPEIHPEAPEEEEIDAMIEACKKLPAETIEAMIDDVVRRSGLPDPASERCLLTWEEVEIMGRQGISFGSHAATHRILTGLPPQEVRRELESSLAALRDRRVNVVVALAYPNGNHDASVRECARLAGYRAAFTTRPGTEGRAPEDRFALKRIGVHQDIAKTEPLFAFHLGRPRGAR